MKESTLLNRNKLLLFAGWEVRIVKSCDRGLENAARGRRPREAFSSSRSQFFTIRTISNEKKLAEKKPRKRYCDRGQKIRTALRTNQIAGFVTVPAWKK